MALSDAMGSAQIRQARVLALRQRIEFNIALATNDRATLARFCEEAPSIDMLRAIADLYFMGRRPRRRRFTQMKHLGLAAEALIRHRKYLAAGKPARGLWKRVIGEVKSRRKVSKRTVENALTEFGITAKKAPEICGR